MTTDTPDHNPDEREITVENDPQRVQRFAMMGEMHCLQGQALLMGCHGCNCVHCRVRLTYNSLVQHIAGEPVPRVMCLLEDFRASLDNLLESGKAQLEEQLAAAQAPTSTKQ